MIYVCRDKYFIKSRDPLLLGIQNICTGVAFSIFLVYIAERPNVQCILPYSGYLLCYSIVVYPMVIRLWVYCLICWVSELKAQHRTIFIQPRWSTAPSVWILRNRWIIGKSFQRIIIIIGSILFTLPILLAKNVKYDMVVNACVDQVSLTVPFMLYVIFITIGTICFIKLIYRSKDAYRVKGELIFFLVLWICVLVATTGIGSRIRGFTPSVLPMFGLVVTFFLSSVLPLVYTWQHDQAMKRRERPTFEYFSEMLESLQFRNIFHEFLSEQFCPENLQFYEAVGYWKSTEEQKQERCEEILNTFIIEDAMCQVHIDSAKRNKIEESIKANLFPDTIFDEALQDILEDMYTNSFLEFTSSSLFASASV